MEIIKNKTDRFKLSEFYKGSETDPTYVFVQQFNDKKLNSENIHIHSLSFLYHTLNSKGKLEIEKKWIDIFPTLNESTTLSITVFRDGLFCCGYDLFFNLFITSAVASSEPS